MARHVVNIYTSRFLYNSNRKLEREIKESISFIITTKWIKYLVINLPKETKGLYTDNYKSVRNKSNMI